MKFTDVATVSLLTPPLLLPEGSGARSLCVVISDLPSGGLDIDVEVVLSVVDGDAGLCDKNVI